MNDQVCQGCDMQSDLCVCKSRTAHEHVYTWTAASSRHEPPVGTPCLGCGHPYEGAAKEAERE